MRATFKFGQSCCKLVKSVSNCSFSGANLQVTGRGSQVIFLYLQNFLRFCFKNHFTKCVLILSYETLTLLYFASRIRPQCGMLHVLKSEVFIQGVGGGWRTRPPLSDFLLIRPWFRCVRQCSACFFHEVCFLLRYYVCEKHIFPRASSGDLLN